MQTPKNEKICYSCEVNEDGKMEKNNERLEVTKIMLNNNSKSYEMNAPRISIKSICQVLVERLFSSLSSVSARRSALSASHCCSQSPSWIR